MAWSPPKNWVNGSVVTDTDMNGVRDQLRYLKGLDGAVQIDSALSVSGAASVAVNTNVSQGLNITNSNSGSSAYTHINLINDTSTAAGFFRASSTSSGYAGANSLNILTIGAHPMAFGTSNQVRLVIDPSGKISLGPYASVAPQGPLDVRGSYGKWVTWEGDSIGGLPVYVLPGGAVQFGLAVQGVIRSSISGAVYTYSTYQGGTIGTPLVPGGAVATLFNDGTNTCILYVNGDGSVVIRRNTGSTTFRVALQLVML